MQPGDVCLIDFPRTDGREQAGVRPAVVLQDDRFAAGSPLVLAAALSSTPGVIRFPAVVPVPVTPENGLTVDSFAMIFQTRATDRRRVIRRLGFVSPTILADIYRALVRLTGRPTAPPPPPTGTP